MGHLKREVSQKLDKLKSCKNKLSSILEDYLNKHNKTKDSQRQKH